MSEAVLLVKVAFRDADGDVETLWAFDLGGGRYKLDNTPWHQYGISYQDVVEAVPDPDGLPFFTKVIQKSGYRTLRMRSDTDISSQLLEDLKAAGANYEGANRRLIAVDVPPGVSLERVVSLVESSGVVWEYADPTYEQIYGSDA